jgi:hypothetical protein
MPKKQPPDLPQIDWREFVDEMLEAAPPRV